MIILNKNKLETVVILAIIALFALGIIYDEIKTSDGKVASNTNTKKHLKKTAKRVWKKSDTGIAYFISCVEGKKMVTTKSTHYHFQMAGPIGECKDTENNNR